MLPFLPAGMTVAATGEPRAAARLAALCHDYWEGTLRARPTMATSLGDRRYDHLLEDITLAGRERERTRLEALRAQAAAIDPATLLAADRVNRSALIEVIEIDLAFLAADFESWVVDPLNGPQVAFLNLPAVQPVKTPVQGHAMAERWRAMSPYLEAHIANLESGAGAGKVATLNQVERVIEQLDELLARPLDDWPLLEPLASIPASFSTDDRNSFTIELRSAAGTVEPAFGRYRDFLRRAILPRARPPERAGLVHLPGGPATYRRLIRAHTSLDSTPEEIHRIGLDEVARIRREMSALGEHELGTGDLPEIFRRLRSDRSLYFRTRDEVEAKARQALERAQAAVPRWFGLLPRTPCEVVRMEPHEEKHSTIAYYREPAIDGSRPGRYYINTYAPETRPRYEAESLAFHESVPGHHLQIAIAHDLAGLPEFRKYTGVTAYVEGWALYAEHLAGEMGLFSGDLDRIGKLSQEAWRACRLVVDTGLHALGWSRQQAIAHLLENSALAENNIANEVDRYITWPGQALAYKLGQLEILRLRGEARRRLGDRFDLQAFHDAVLQNGAVGLATLRALVEELYEGKGSP